MFVATWYMLCFDVPAYYVDLGVCMLCALWAPDKDLIATFRDVHTGNSRCTSVSVLLNRGLTLRQLVHHWTFEDITSTQTIKDGEIRSPDVEPLTEPDRKRHHWDITMSGEYILTVVHALHNVYIDQCISDLLKKKCVWSLVMVT